MAAILRRKGALSVEQVYSLIDNVRSFPCIWNPEHQQYTHRVVVANAWTKIAKQVQLPEDVIRAKWKNLRDLFMKECKKMNVQSLDNYCGQWKYFKKLSFLYRAYSKDQVLSEYDEEDGNEVTGDPNHEYEVKVEPSDADVNEFMFLDTENEVNDILSENQMRSDNNSKHDRDEANDIFAEPAKRRRLDLTYSDEDCDMMFLMSLSPYFKRLQPVRKLALRHKMQEMLLKEFERSAMNGHL